MGVGVLVGVWVGILVGVGVLLGLGVGVFDGVGVLVGKGRIVGVCVSVGVGVIPQGSFQLLPRQERTASPGPKTSRQRFSKQSR